MVREQLTAAGGASAPPVVRLTDAAGAVRPLEEIKRDAVRLAVAYYDGHVSKAARHLRIGRATLYRRLPAPARRSAYREDAR